MGEWLLVVVCIAVIRFAKADVRDIFPLKTPRVVNSIGVVMMWIGVMLLEMALLCVIAVFFPEQFFGVQSGMQDQFMGIPLGMLVLVVAVTPAICEEVLFRGVFLNSLERGGWWKNRWISVVICGLVFGMFHGDWIRMIPTAIAGIVMSYLLLETGNLFYNCLFHFVNNLFSVLSVYFVQQIFFTASAGTESGDGIAGKYADAFGDRWALCVFERGGAGMYLYRQLFDAQ